MIRLLVIGCGQISRAAHLPALQQLQDEGRVDVSVFDVDPTQSRAACEHFGMRMVDDWQDAAAGMDAVSVCVPPGPNAEISLAAVAMGLHVLCEKPPGRNLEQAGRMAAAAEANPGRVATIGFNRRFAPLYLRAIERSSRIGLPTSYYGRFSRGALGAAPSNTASDWITSDSSHALDLAVATMGFPHAVAIARGAVGGGPDNVWSLQLHTDQGSALLQLNYAAGSRVEAVEWVGPGYDVRIELPDSARWAEAGQTAESWSTAEVSSPVPWYEASGFLDEYRAFLNAIVGTGPRPPCDFHYGAEFMRLVTTILEAPSGSLQVVARTTRERAAQQSSSAPPVRAGRPVALLHHALTAQSRFFPPDALAALEARCEVRTWRDDDPHALEDANVLVTGRGAPPLSPQMLERARKLELAVVLGASVRHFEPQELLERGVTICNTADAVAQGVAEHCLMVTLAGLRELTRHDADMHRRGWGLQAKPGRARFSARLRSPVMRLARTLLPLRVKKRMLRLGDRASGGSAQPGVDGSAGDGQREPSDLQGQVVGLLGWGHVARRFARLLAAFDCRVLVWTESATPDELAAAGARPASLSEILGSARVVSLHRGLTEQTRGFVDARLLSQIRPGSVLVNTARGSLIDEEALVARLQKGDIVAALDVFDHEPLPPKHPLRKLPNVILTPHNASATLQEEARMGTQAMQCVIDWAEGKNVDAIDDTRLSRMS